MPRQSSTRAAAAVDRRIDDGLHTAVEDQHLAGMACTRPRGGRTGYRHLAPQLLRQQRRQPTRDADEHGEQSRRRQHHAKGAAKQIYRPRPADAGLDVRPSDIEQAAVLHSRRTGRFARTARQASIQVQLRRCGNLLAFERRADELDPPARAIELVAQQLIRRTGRETEPAVHAFADDCIGFRRGGLRHHSSVAALQLSTA